ncbi:type VI secretion system ImpA family N-terminal domain-containing protein [Massilia sp. SR12]
MFTNEDLLVPLGESYPCGEDVSFDACMDVIAAARRQDDPTLEQGEWAKPLHSADWPLVASRCAELLRTRSKDLRLAVWLAEARAHTHQLRGLGDGFILLARLCERYWEHVHPLPEGGEQELRTGNLAWLLGRTPGLVAAMPAALDAAALQDTQYCVDGLQALQAAVDARLGADGPSFGAAREALQGALETARRHAPQASAGQPASGDPCRAGWPGAWTANEAGLAGPAAEAAPANTPGARTSARPLAPQSREHALAQLRLVADFFRRTEPHSPVAYLADKAANWGELPLHEWLRAVVKDPAQLAQFDELLGAAAPLPS